MAIYPNGAAEPATGDTIGGRYQVVAPIGRGGMGAVFEGTDAVLDRPVAIKLLSVAGDAAQAASARVIEEGRAMARVRHPACVQVFDRGIDPRYGAYLIMERLDGEDLARYLRARGPLPAPLAMALMEQICEAIAAIHDAGVIHRDLKPANVFILRHDRGARPDIKILDFGIARTGAVLGDVQQPWTQGGAAGTAPYMAPECWRDDHVPAISSDVYALGAIFYEMLSATPPFRAESRAALRLAILNDSPDPLRDRRQDLPDHLLSAIGLALSKNPGERPADVRSFAAALALHRYLAPKGRAEWTTVGAAPTVNDDVSTPAAAHDTDSVFVGRHDALSALDQALDEAAGGLPRVILIEGASGMGKTAVLERFRHLREGEATFLSGRARETDSIPFPALDQAIDELVARMLVQSPAATPRPLSAAARRAARLFPALARLPGVGLPSSAQGDRSLSDPLTSRLDAFDAVRALLGRLCEDSPLVLLLDDLQWLDPDSAALLAHVLSSQGSPPALLLVGAVRSRDAEPPAGLAWLKAINTQYVRRIRLRPLPHEEACALIQARWRGDQPPTAEVVARLAHQSGGVPFLAELMTSALLEDELPRNAELEEAVAQRYRALPPAAQQALAMICISSRPLLERLVLEAAGTDRSAALASLHAWSFIRSRDSAGGRVLEPYHDRIRESVQALLSDSERSELHRRVAARLRVHPSVAPEVLAEHVSGSGDARTAFTVAMTAAEAANAQLAFDRAAALFALAASYQPALESRLDVVQHQATALERADRRTEAGEILLQAAEAAVDTAQANTLRRRAGTDFLLSGKIDRGLETLMPVLSAAGVVVPATLESTVRSTMEGLAALTARGVVPGRSDAPAAAASLSERADLCLVLAEGLAHIDLRVLPFACQALLAALDVGDPHRLQRACALFVINTVEYMPNPLVDPVLDLCRELTRQVGTPIARALLEMAHAEHAHFNSDFLAAEAAFERAERILLLSCPGATRELTTARDIAVFIQYAQKGDFRTQLERTERWLSEAEAARDLFHTSMLRVAHAIVWIAHDQPERARSELERARRDWTGEGGVLEVAAALYHDIIDRYQESDLDGAAPGTMRSSLLRSPAAQTPFLGGYLGLQAVWAGLRALADGRSPATVAASLRDDIARMRGLGLPIWIAVSDALDGNLNYLLGEAETAIAQLEGAEQQFRRLHMLCLAACARKRRGQFMAGELGARLERESDDDLRSLGVARPDRWARAYWSMFDARAVHQRTIDSVDTAGALSGKAARSV